MESSRVVAFLGIGNSPVLMRSKVDGVSAWFVRVWRTFRLVGRGLSGSALRHFIVIVSEY